MRCTSTCGRPTSTPRDHSVTTAPRGRPRPPGPVAPSVSRRRAGRRLGRAAAGGRHAFGVGARHALRCGACSAREVRPTLLRGVSTQVGTSSVQGHVSRQGQPWVLSSRSAASGWRRRSTASCCARRATSVATRSDLTSSGTGGIRPARSRPSPTVGVVRVSGGVCTESLATSGAAERFHTLPAEAP